MNFTHGNIQIEEAQENKTNATSDLGTKEIKNVLRDVDALEASLAFKVPLDFKWVKEKNIFNYTNSKWYIKPKFGFIIPEDDENEINNDFLFDGSAYIGFDLLSSSDSKANTPTKSYFKKFFLEAGYGYTERFEEKSRFRSNLWLEYEFGDNWGAFLSMKLDADLKSGPDDFRISYGLNIDLGNILSVSEIGPKIGGIFTGIGKSLE
ncbi:hypothetical protein GMMP15_630002 [Candidatus Magnetomoraceae bacterium gMMP-15]